MKVGVVALCASLAAGCGASGGSGGSGGDGKPLKKVKIVSDLPLQGSSRAQTESMVKAIKMKLEEIGYKAGSIPIEYESKDDSTAQAGKWDEAKCTQNMTEAVSDPEAVVVIGPFNSGCAQVQIKISNQGGLAMVSPANTAVGLTKSGGDPGEPDKYYPTKIRNYVRVALADDLQGKAAALWARELGKKKAFVLHDKETYGKGIADQFQSAAEKGGIKVVGFEGIDPQATNYRGLVPKIQQKGAEIVYFGGITQNNAGQLIKDIRSSMPGVIFMGPDGIYEDAFTEAAGKAAEGSLATFGGLPPEKLVGTGAAFIKKYTQKNGAPQAYTAYAYDAAGIVVEAIKRCADGKGVTRKCVVEQLFATKDYQGALGTFSISETGDTTLTVLSGLEVKGGAWKFSRALDVSKL
jgi:branched-chain amino acid transport system substrate-binding protein